MKKLTIILILLISFVTEAQLIKKQILENISEIKSVDINSNDFSDLKVIGNAIGDAEIVFLGEQSHGDATTFEAKARLVKYLHEQKGFNVLAFESDFFNINKKADEKQPISEIEKNIFAIWSNCIQVNQLFEYIKKQQKINPIIVSGFDCQIAQSDNDTDKKLYLNTMISYIEKKIDTSHITDYKLFTKTLTDLIFYVKATKTKNAHFKKIKKAVRKKYFKTLSEILNKIKNKKSFLYQSLKSVDAYAHMAWTKTDKKRDIQMGENILWLHNIKFPKEKIIIWAHSVHLVKKVTNEKGRRKIHFKNITAGEYVCDHLDNNKVYSIGFSSRKGASQRVSAHTKYNQKETIKPSNSETFENWVHTKNYDFAFVDFKKLKNNSEQFHLRGLSHQSIFKVNWLTAFDGVFYIEEMFPCIREK